MNLNSYAFRDITLGQYFPVESLLHKLDPRVKIFGTFVFVVALFLATGPVGYAFIAGYIILVFILSKIPLAYLFVHILPALGFILFISVFQLFSSGDEYLIRIGAVGITSSSLANTLTMIYRLLALLLGASFMTFTTTPRDLTDGLEKGLGFLKYVKIPVHDIAMAMSIALRFIPVLSEEAVKIIRAQVSRGSDFEEGNFFKRVLNMVPLLIPLLVSAFKIASDLSVAMESRCYRGSVQRTKMYPLAYTVKDMVAYGFIMIFFGAVLAVRLLKLSELIPKFSGS